jgi:hypothetical protein
MFGQRYGDLVKSLSNALELSNDLAVLSSPQTEQKLSETLQKDNNLLALYLQPVGAEALSLYRPGSIAREELENIANEALVSSGATDLFMGAPRRSASGESVIAMISQVNVDNRTIASVAAIVSLREISKSVVGTSEQREEELWKAGLPIIFVVNQSGKAIFHPDNALVDAQRSLTDLKIVDEWQQSNRQIQSGLVPFTAQFAGKSYDMIGAYSTARFGSGSSFGVITMQDERKALASVGENALANVDDQPCFRVLCNVDRIICGTHFDIAYLKAVGGRRKDSLGRPVDPCKFEKYYRDRDVGAFFQFDER